MLNKSTEMQFICNLSKDIINNKIKTMEDLQKNIPPNKFENKFSKRLLDDIIDAFEHMPAENGPNGKEPFELLNIYLIAKLLEYDKDIEALEVAYKNILAIEQLDRKNIDEKLIEFLEMAK